MDVQIPETPRNVIERLRLEHSPDGHSKVSSIIKNALEIMVFSEHTDVNFDRRISTELYDTSTHFLLEFLQNADDNDYDPAVVPRLQFTYASGFLRVDCNEVGFNASNVEAICNIRSSTKSGQDHVGRTGEKGIGFKSVFKVADVVWIRSGEFAFKFDKARPFGIIAPVWEEFPQSVLENHTSFLLQLNDRCDKVELITTLLNLDQTCLLFTRRLRHITVRVTQDNQTETKEMRRRVETDANGQITVLDVGDQVFTYIITRRQVENLPHEPKRLGLKTSELVLAFPALEDATNATWRIQNVHNVLPIGKYGLKV
ncbi:hypothetical protein INS49_004209 [Diaporthe citri]|uniref:uncharacterized protein n=1 Tax=Diaporthe citri TaxID=83186 RepID=UPI001C814904|nr:uncharacterized protein INS49_004209 [Diaporthe citri]KAG6355128.1 hypothetical protein INS49_004209 [Diaporthe citri]